MGVFSRTPQSRPLDRMGRLQTMVDMPFTMTRNIAEQAQQGALDSYGLGTVIREGMTPQGNTVNDATPSILPNPVQSLGRLAQGVGGMIRGGEAQPSLSEDEYKASPYYREDIPFETGMTEDRAAALSSFYDTKKVREYFGAKRPISTFLGQFAGQALDPINYVPVFGPAAEVAAVTRFGSIAGRALVGASDAAINTAAFGVLSAGVRSEFGDDVSWQAMTNEIAMSALIGGAFGAISPVVKAAWSATAGRSASARAREAEAKTASGLANLQNLKEGRAVLNEAVGQMVETGEVNLSPNSQAIVERIQTEVTGRAAAVRALDDQTANIDTGQPVAITPSGQRVNVRPEVVDASTLVRASGDLQVRNRSSQASAAQIEEIAVNLDPARLMPSVDADSGAPIVGPDNIVDSGNGRVSAIARAYEAYPARAKAYRDALEAQGYDLTGIQNPVLINRRTTDLSREARALFNAEANAPRAAQMNAVELASMDRNALEGTLDILDASPVTSPANRAFVQRFMGNLSPSARAALVDANGGLNADGARRIENALVAAAYGDVDVGVLRRFAEATDDNTRAIVGAMSDVAGRWAQMRQSIKRGDISPEYDMTSELTESLRRIGQWREQAAAERRPVSQVIKEGMAQLDLLSGEISPEAQVIIGAFYRSNSFSQAAGRDTIAEFLGRVVSDAEELGRPQLFEDAVVSRLEFVRNATNDEQANLFTPAGAVDGIEADGGFTRGTPPAADSQNGGPATREVGIVGQRVSERFAAAGRPEAEAKALGSIVDAFYAQQGARLGLTTDEMIAEFGLPEVRQGGDVPAAALAQSPDSPAFREWFGDSKVVDEAGEPLVVYHGSTAKGIDAFDPDKLNDKTRGTGFWFSDGGGKADTYAGPEGEVYPTYLKMERPVIVEWDGHWADGPAVDYVEYRIKDADGFEVGGRGYFEERGTVEAALQRMKDAGDDTSGYVIEETPVRGEKTTDEYVRRIRRENPDADGIILRNVAGGGDMAGDFAGLVRGDEYVVFEPTQIKSVNNRGTFDPNDPRILNQPAYHGTPHLFETFSTDKIGTGEGAQAYGWGLYFAGNRAVSEQYRNVLSPAQITVGGRDVQNSSNPDERLAASYIKQAGGDIARAITAARSERAGPAITDMIEQFDRDGLSFVSEGRLYTAQIPDDNVLLDWDAPLSEQPPAVKAALSAIDEDMWSPDGGDYDPSEPGQIAYQRLSSMLGSDKAASEKLKESGVLGLRYFDGDSRDAQDGSRNYVVFDGRDASIDRLEQRGSAGPRGSIQLGDTNVITLFETADASTALHETGHMFLSMLKGMGEKGDAPDAIKADWESVREWWRGNAEAVAADANASGRAAGVTGKNVIDALDLGTTGDAAKDRAIDVGMQEQWARGFEAYVREGNAPSSGLARAFEQFRQWLRDIYRRAEDLNVKLSDDIRQVFDNLLAEPAAPPARAVPTIDGMPVRVSDPNAPKAVEPPTAQAAMLFNEPDTAAARVGKDESLRDIALSHGVDPTTGAYVEAGDIAQLREEGRLTADDEADLAAADQMFADAEAYARALDAAISCVV